MIHSHKSNKNRDESLLRCFCFCGFCQCPFTMAQQSLSLHSRPYLPQTKASFFNPCVIFLFLSFFLFASLQGTKSTTKAVTVANFTTPVLGQYFCQSVILSFNSSTARSLSLSLLLCPCQTICLHFHSVCLSIYVHTSLIFLSLYIFILFDSRARSYTISMSFN